jgi:hypothetical protein
VTMLSSCLGDIKFSYIESFLEIKMLNLVAILCFM